MLFDVKHRTDAVAHVQLTGALRHTDSLAALEPLFRSLISQGKAVVVLDCRRIDAVRHAGTSAFVAMMIHERSVPVVAFGLPKKLTNNLKQAGVEHALHIFDTLGDALSDPVVQSRQLRNKRAIVLCPDLEGHFGPLGELTSAPMLDVLGCPAIVRTLDHLERYGIRDIVLTPGRSATEIIGYFQKFPRLSQSLFYVDAHAGVSGRHSSISPECSSLLYRLHREHHLFHDDILVLDGRGLPDVNLSGLFERHSSTAADLTLALQAASPNSEHAFRNIEVDWKGRLAEATGGARPNAIKPRIRASGAFVMNGSAAHLIPDDKPLSLANDMPLLAHRAGLNVQGYMPRHNVAPLTSANEYIKLLHGGLSGRLENARPQCAPTQDQQFIDRSAQVSSRARVNGPCYVAPGADIAAGAVLSGPVIIGAGARIETGAVVQDSFVLDGTRISRGSHVDGQIVSADWSFSWAHDAPNANPSPLEGTGPVHEELPMGHTIRETG